MEKRRGQRKGTAPAFGAGRKYLGRTVRTRLDNFGGGQDQGGSQDDWETDDHWGGGGQEENKFCQFRSKVGGTEKGVLRIMKNGRCR